jgi:Uma2 family endonuclease
MATPVIEAPPTNETGEQRIPMSYEAYLAWHDEGQRGEWIDGEVIVFMAPLDKHQEIVGFIYQMIAQFVMLFRLGVVRIAPLEMRTRPDGPAREPDVLFLSETNRARLTSRRLEGAADLIVEVISDESVGRDRGDKFYEYEEAGVSEYWIIDPRPGKQRVDVWYLAADGRYQPALPDGEGRYHSRVLAGFALRAQWLWEEPLPDPLLALAEMRGLSPDAAQQLRNALLGAR